MRLDSGAADLAWKMRRLNDLYSATPVFPGELLSVTAFQHLDLLRERARQIVEADRKLLRDFLKQQSSLSAVSTPWARHHFHDCSTETPTFSSALAFRNSKPPQFQAGFSKCRIIRIGTGVNTEMFAEPQPDRSRLA